VLLNLIICGTSNYSSISYRYYYQPKMLTTRYCIYKCWRLFHSTEAMHQSKQLGVPVHMEVTHLVERSAKAILRDPLHDYARNLPIMLCYTAQNFGLPSHNIYTMSQQNEAIHSNKKLKKLKPCYYKL